MSLFSSIRMKQYEFYGIPIIELTALEHLSNNFHSKHIDGSIVDALISLRDSLNNKVVQVFLTVLSNNIENVRTYLPLSMFNSQLLSLYNRQFLFDPLPPLGRGYGSGCWCGDHPLITFVFDVSIGGPFVRARANANANARGVRLLEVDHTDMYMNCGKMLLVQTTGETKTLQVHKLLDFHGNELVVTETSVRHFLNTTLHRSFVALHAYQNHLAVPIPISTAFISHIPRTHVLYPSLYPIAFTTLNLADDFNIDVIQSSFFDKIAMSIFANETERQYHLNNTHKGAVEFDELKKVRTSFARDYCLLFRKTRDYFRSMFVRYEFNTDPHVLEFWHDIHHSTSSTPNTKPISTMNAESFGRAMAVYVTNCGTHMLFNETIKLTQSGLTIEFSTGLHTTMDQNNAVTNFLSYFHNVVTKNAPKLLDTNDQELRAVFRSVHDTISARNARRRFVCELFDPAKTNNGIYV